MKKEVKRTLKKDIRYKANFVVNKEIYSCFKQMCLLNDTDASKEIRQHIRQYLEVHGLYFEYDLDSNEE